MARNFSALGLNLRFHPRRWLVRTIIAPIIALWALRLRDVSPFQASADAHLRRVAETQPTALELEFGEEGTRRLRDLGHIE